jgi:hypothetical protein
VQSGSWRHARHVLRFALVASSLGTAREVEASELIVVWTAPPECPDEADVLSEVEDSLGDGANVNLTATAIVTRAAGVFRAHVHVTSPAGLGERVLENSRCELLAESVAVVIALSAPRGSERRKLASESSAGLAPALSAHAAAVVGPLPHPALGAGGTFALEGLAALRFELGGTYYAGQSATFDRMSIGARFQLLAFGARACRVWVLRAYELAPCLGARLYRIAGRGFGGMLQSSGDLLMWGPALGVLGRVRLLHQLALMLTMDGVVPFPRRTFVFSDVDPPLHRPSVFAWQLFFGPEVRF